MLKFITITLLLIGSLAAQDMNYSSFGMDTTGVGKVTGLEVGSMAPQFSGLDQNGNVIDLSKIIVEKPVVLIFYRGQ